jgi:hypothetical protein
MELFIIDYTARSGNRLSSKIAVSSRIRRHPLSSLVKIGPNANATKNPTA